jgi:hypothetical protein
MEGGEQGRSKRSTGLNRVPGVNGGETGGPEGTRKQTGSELEVCQTGVNALAREEMYCQIHKYG